MPTWDDVVAIGLSLPETEVSTWYRTPGMKAAGRGFLRLRTEAEGGLVVFCDLEKKDALLRSGSPTFYTTPHYDGYGAILVNLKRVTRAELTHLITESWRRVAPLKLLRAFDAAHPLAEGAEPTGPRPAARRVARRRKAPRRRE